MATERQEDVLLEPSTKYMPLMKKVGEAGRTKGFGRVREKEEEHRKTEEEHRETRKEPRGFGGEEEHHGTQGKEGVFLVLFVFQDA